MNLTPAESAARLEVALRCLKSQVSPEAKAGAIMEIVRIHAAIMINGLNGDHLNEAELKQAVDNCISGYGAMIYTTSQVYLGQRNLNDMAGAKFLADLLLNMQDNLLERGMKEMPRAIIRKDKGS